MQRLISCSTITLAISSFHSSMPMFVDPGGHHLVPEVVNEKELKKNIWSSNVTRVEQGRESASGACFEGAPEHPQVHWESVTVEVALHCPFLATEAWQLAPHQTVHLVG